MVVPLPFDRLPRCVCGLVVAGPRFRLAQFIPCHRRALMATIARHVVGPRLDALPMPACRADGVRQRENSSQSLDDARLTAHDRPPFRRMITNLEEATIDRHVVPIDVEDDDVARGDADHGIPGTAPQRMRAGGTDARPTFHLKASGCDHPVGTFHACRLPTCASGRRDWSHRACGRRPVQPHSENPQT